MRFALVALGLGLVGGEFATHAKPAAVRTPPARATRQQGGGSVKLTVDGRPRSDTGLIVKPRRIVIDNGVFRLTWHDQLCEPAAFEADVLADGGWVDASAHCVGDWLYPGGPVQSQPTEVEVLRADSGMVALRLRFGDHWIRPRLEGYPSWYVDQRYPFSRTVWLRAGERGYFTQIVIEKKPVFPYPDIEHEVGFGGLWGPGEVRTARDSYRTDTLTKSMFTNLRRQLDAAEFRRDGDRVLRVLVPLGTAPMITPVFKSSFGGVYVYSLGPTTKYGAYLYAAPTAGASNARAVCQFAWRNAPFELPPMPRDSLARCGPGA